MPADVRDEDAIAGTRRRLPAAAVWLISPLIRSRQSALALAPLQTPTVVPDLTEQHFGTWPGRTHAAIWDADPDAAARFWQEPAGNTPPGGESFNAVCDRVAAAIDRLTNVHAGRDIVMVGHAGPIRAALALCLGLPPASALSIAVDHWHLFHLDHLSIGGQDGQWRLINANIPPC